MSIVQFLISVRLIKRTKLYYEPGRECAQHLSQLAIVRTLSWPAGILWLAVTAVACTSFRVYAN